MALLCSMARFPFYRPAIRKAEPAGALTSMLEAGCSPVSLPVHISIVALLIHTSARLVNVTTWMYVLLSRQVVKCQCAKVRLVGSDSFRASGMQSI